MSQYTLKQKCDAAPEEPSLTPEENFEGALKLIKASTTKVAKQTLAALSEMSCIVDTSKYGDGDPMKNRACYNPQGREICVNLSKHGTIN